MTRDRPRADHWDPLSIAEARRLLLSASFRWWVCGGLALELYVGDAWRPHGDLDIGVLRTEAADVYDWLSPDWDLWVAARGALRPWDGLPLGSERDENNVWVRQAADTPWVLDLTVGSGNDTDWIYRRDETIRRSWDDAILWTGHGVPYLAPEIQLLFKSKDSRPKDHADAQKTIPEMGPHRQRFLAECLSSDHPWHQLLEPG